MSGGNVDSATLAGVLRSQSVSVKECDGLPRSLHELPPVSRHPSLDWLGGVSLAADTSHGTSGNA